VRNEVKRREWVDALSSYLVSWSGVTLRHCDFGQNGALPVYSAVSSRCILS